MESNHTTVGIDITTGFAADSYFFPESGRYDPWKEESLENLIDLVINHESTVFPSPTNLARENLDVSQIFPHIFSKEFDLIQPYKRKTAEEITLSEEKMIEEFDIFKKWTYDNSINFKEWVRFHTKSDSVKSRQEKNFPIYSRLHTKSDSVKPRQEKNLSEILSRRIFRNKEPNKPSK